MMGKSLFIVDESDVPSIYFNYKMLWHGFFFVYSD